MYQPVSCVPVLGLLFVAFAGGIGCGGDANPLMGPASDGLVFARLVDGNEDLIRARLSDGAEKPLTTTPDRRELWPMWSSDANALAYETLDLAPNARSDLTLWTAVDGNETKLTDTPVRRETWVSWSPRGRRLAFAFRGGNQSGGPSGGIAVRDLDAKYSAPVARTGDEAAYIRPHFDPTGRRIVVQRKAPRGGSHLWIVGLRQKPRPLTRDAEWLDIKGWFTRDGERVIYTRRLAAGGPHQIASVLPSGQDLRVLAESDAASDDHSARPSPTRDEIVFVSDRDGAPDLYLAGLDGSAPRRLTRSPDQSEFAPSWSPDGQRIVATVTPLALGRPRIVDPDGLEQTRVVVFDREGRLLFEAPGFMPDWMPPWP